jgi:hypothetical protein
VIFDKIILQEIMEATKQWDDIFEMLKEKNNWKAKLLILAKLSLKCRDN